MTSHVQFEADPGRGSAATLQEQTFDIVLMADMTRAGDIGLRIAQEIRTYFDMGYRMGLVHLPSPRSGPRISPDVQGCVREAMAEVIDPKWSVQAKLVIVHTPQVLSEFPDHLGNFAAEHVILVHDRPPLTKQMGRWFGLLFGSMSWAPTNQWVRGAIERLRLPMRTEAEDWRAIGRAPANAKAPSRDNRRLAIGRVSATDPGQWPETAEELAQVFPIDGSTDVYFLGRPPADLIPSPRGSETWTILDHGDISVERFIGLIDAFVYFPSRDAPELPDAAISAAMSAGKIVVLPQGLRPHFGPGAVYCQPDKAIATITSLFQDSNALTLAREAAVYHAAHQFSEGRHRERIERLIGPSTRGPVFTAKKKGARPRRELFLPSNGIGLGHVTRLLAIARRTAGRFDPVGPPSRRSAFVAKKKGARPPRALFLPSNGIGLGHVTRLLAIARRTAGRFDPVFATMAQAVPIIESFGYIAEYIPSQSDVGADQSTWDAWFRVELQHLIDSYDAELVVFDGNNPTPGMVNAVLSHRRCKLAWVRRGMGKETPSPFMENARFCDLIIEPGELSAERDSGPTSLRRHEVSMVRPIRLLDGEELLTREEAVAALELDDARPAVLVHLGAGSNRDLLHTVDAIIQDLRQFAGLQIVIAEWPNGPTPLSLWPDTKTIRGYPLSQYFKAFDFSIAAAGYNTFHEVISHALPTIFVPNTHPSMDDQAARAEFAQDATAGLHLPENQLSYLPAICEVLLDERGREQVRQNCRRIRQDNGAAEAADILAQLVSVT